MSNRMVIRKIVLSACLFTCLVSWRGKEPHIFLLGDSISIHYGPYLKNFLENDVELEQKKAETLDGREFSRNGGDSRRVLDYLTAKLKQTGFKPDYILLNCGLHDMGRDSTTRTFRVPPDAYRKNLEQILTMVQAKKIRVIWITTTPVVDSIHNTRIKELARYAADQEIYNRIAAEVCSKYHLGVIDLYDFTRKLGPGAYIDNVHYNDSTRVLQAAYIAGALKQILKADKAINQKRNEPA